MVVNVLTEVKIPDSNVHFEENGLLCSYERKSPSCNTSNQIDFFVDKDSYIKLHDGVLVCLPSEMLMAEFVNGRPYEYKLWKNIVADYKVTVGEKK